MGVGLHKLSDTAHFAALRDERTAASTGWLRDAEAAEGDLHYTYQCLRDWALDLAAIGLILGSGDDEVLAHYADAVRFGVTLVTGRWASPEFRSAELRVSVSETGVHLDAVRDHSWPAGERPLNPVDYRSTLATVVAFAGESERRVVAGIPEERYRNPNIEVDESHFFEVRALKSWCFGERERAAAALRSGLKICRDPYLRPSIGAFLAVAEKDQRQFIACLEEAVKAYQSMYRRKPNVPEGVVYLYGLALCRLALEEGLAVEDGPYLPTRLLPRGCPPQ